MPIYEFSCNDCGKIFDLLVFPQDEVEMKCPDCGSLEVGKLMSATKHTMGTSNLRTDSGGRGGVSCKECGSGSCTTIDIPGRV